MQLCKECGMVEGGVKTKVEDFETYEVCAHCGFPDCVINVNEDDFKDRITKAPCESEFYD
jgi:hypothetical protein